MAKKVEFSKDTKVASVKGDIPWRKRIEATDKVCEDPNFKYWLGRTLEDISAFNDDEVPLTEFGQGIRRTASHIMNSLLVSEKGAKVLTELYEEHFNRVHQRMMNGNKQKQEAK